MLRREELIKKFIFGMSVFEAYISHTGSLNLRDINILGENFIADLLNLLYGFQLKNANSRIQNNKGYDLRDDRNKIIVQITSTDTTQKLAHTLNVLEKVEKGYIQSECELRSQKVMRAKENESWKYMEERGSELKKSPGSMVNLNGYTLYFFILKSSAENVRKYKKKYTGALLFDIEKNILDFNTLIRCVNDLSEINGLQMEKLELFMNKNSSLFNIPNLQELSYSKVNAIINEYAENFTEKLFRHKYKPKSEVTLNRLYIDPAIEYNGDKSRDLIKVLGQFLWNEVQDRILFIEGDAAIGKTSLFSYLCYHYKNGDDIGKAVFLGSKVICIRLRELDFTDKKKKIQQTIQEYLGITDFHEFKEEYRSSVLLLDGADEISMLEGWGSSGIEELLLAIRKIFSNNKIVITTRPQFVDMEKFKSRNFNIKVLRLLHFNKNMREEWLEKYQSCRETIAESTKEYIINIADETAEGVADTPLALYLLAACEIRKELQGNVWALYHEIFNNAIINTEYNENFEGYQEHPIREHEQILFQVICRIAFKMYQNSEEERYYITSEELDEIVETFGTDKKESEWIRKCCVLCAYWKKNENIGALEFYHNNIRDYFVEEYLYERLDPLLEDSSENGIKRVLKEACDLLSYGEIAGTTWEQFYLLLYEKIRYLTESGKRKYKKEEIQKCLAKIYSMILSQDTTIWCYPYGENNYQHIKYVIKNLLMLVRIYQEVLFDRSEYARNLFWASEEDKKRILKSNILSDFSELFKTKICLPNKKIILISQYCDINKVSFEGRNWENITFEDVLLENNIFRNTKLDRVTFKNCKLIDVDFSSVDMKKVSFINTLVENADFTRAKLENCRFMSESKLIGGRFDDCIIENSNFENVRLKNINWSCAKVQQGFWSDVEYIVCDMQRLKMEESEIVDCKFKICNMEKMNMEKSFIRRNNFLECSLDESRLTHARLINNVIRSSTCKKVGLKESKIFENRIYNSKFDNAVFTQASISDNRWKNITFVNADFKHAIIKEEECVALEKLGANLTWATRAEKVGMT